MSVGGVGGVMLLAQLVLMANVPPSFAQNVPNRFKAAEAGYVFSFPRDHGSHPVYRTEWWYFTGNLESKDKKEYGYELTFFRQGIDNLKAHQNRSRWAVRDLYFAHFALTDVARGQFYFQERMSRKALGQAGAKEERLEVWIDRWRIRQEGDQIHLIAEAQGDERFAIQFVLTPVKPPAIHGEKGISQKGEEAGQASHYYSLTRIKTEGSLWVNGEKTRVEGISWMDHEFGSSFLNAHQIGWDWFSIQLEDGNEVMLYHIRGDDGRGDSHSSGTWIYPDGKTRHLALGDFKLTPIGYWTSKKSGGRYPIRWRIEVPSEGFWIESQPAFSHQELITQKSTRVIYWEGASRFYGIRQGRPIKGLGYVELTGYAHPSRRGLFE